MKVKNPGNNIINHVYKNILKRNDILKDSLFNLNFNREADTLDKNKKKEVYIL